RTLARIPAQVDLFREEGRIAQLLDHPNLVHAFDAGMAGDDHFIAMELVVGPSLAGLAAEGRLDPGRALAIVLDLTAGLDHVHRAGLVHADVSPSNVLIGSDRAKLTDF